MFEKMNEKKKESVSRDLPALHDSLRELDTPLQVAQQLYMGNCAISSFVALNREK